MNIIRGTVGSGKSNKVVQLASNLISEGKKVKIISGELSAQQYADRFNGTYQSDENLTIAFINNHSLSNIVSKIIQTYEKDESDAVFIDVPTSLLREDDFELLSVIEKFTGISIYITKQTISDIGKNIEIVEWEK